MPSRAACLPGGGHGGRPALAVEPRCDATRVAAASFWVRHSSCGWSRSRFVVDAMMGRLLRWLRVLGVDSLLREEGESLHALFGRCQASA